MPDLIEGENIDRIYLKITPTQTKRIIESNRIFQGQTIKGHYFSSKNFSIT